tara:strand:- start:1378 stop:1929 length:552 start_codon:yes stop_codon:yes gene_type:complete
MIIMLTPSIRAYNYSIKSHDAYAHWYAAQIGVTNGDIIAAGQKRSLHLIEKAVNALLNTVVVEEVSDTLPEEVFKATVELATPEEIGDSKDFPADLTYDAMTVKELKVQCTSRGLPTSGTKAEIALRLKRDDEGISESMTESEAPAETAAEDESDAPADEAAVTKGETNDHSDNKQKSIDETE